MTPTLADAIKVGAALGVGAKGTVEEEEYTRGAIELIADMFLPRSSIGEATNALTLIFEALYEGDA